MLYRLCFVALMVCFNQSTAFSQVEDHRTQRTSPSAPTIVSPVKIAPASDSIPSVKVAIESDKEAHVIFPDKTVVPGPCSIEGRDSNSSNVPIQKTPKLFTVAAAAGANVATLPLFPLELIRQRRMLNSSQTGNLLKGLGPFAAASITSTVLGMSSYRILRENGFAALEAGAIGTVLNNYITNPLYLFQLKYSSAPLDQPYLWKQFKAELTPPSQVSAVAKAKYIGSAAFRGQVAAMGSVPSQAGFYYLYHEMNKFLKSRMGGETGSSTEFCRHDLAAGVARAAVTPTQYPFETLRGIRQKEDLTYDQILQRLVKEGGAKNFYKGVWPSLARSAIGTSVYVATFSSLLKVFKAMNENPGS